MEKGITWTDLEKMKSDQLEEKALSFFLREQGTLGVGN